MNKTIYLDNAATTEVRPEVIETMTEVLKDVYGNPSSTLYSLGKRAKTVLEDSRSAVAELVNANPEEIYFTACGSESDNWAIKGTAFAKMNKGKHIITSKIEHHAIFNTCKYLKKFGFETTYLDVDENGFVDLEQLKASIRPDTILISIMFANNEIGTIEPIKEIAKIAHEHGIYFHCDAVQALGAVKIDVKDLDVDMMSFSAHKIHGPKGIGALYMKKGVRIDNLIHGGAQESGKRAGTESLHNIAGFGKACQINMNEFDKKNNYLTKMRDLLISELQSNIGHTHLNGDPIKRLPNNVNMSFDFIEGESILLWLDLGDICASTGSACSSGSLSASHVILALGLDIEVAHSSIRFTVGEKTTEEDIHYVVKEMKRIVEKLREMSPLYSDYIKANSLKCQG